MKIFIKGVLFCLSLSVLQACKINDENNEKVVEHEFEKEIDDPNLPLDVRAKKQAAYKLAIPANENFNVQLYEAYLNDDNMADAIITVNRKEFAKQRTKDLKNTEVINRDGIVGNYNFILIFDGATNQFSVPVPIPSSAKYELEVNFEYLFSDSYSTPVITYRIKDGEFKNFYHISSDGIMDKVFKMKSYEFVGQPKEEAYTYEIQKSGMFSFVKDIKVYKGKLENSKEISKNWFETKSKISKTNTLDKDWFFDPKRNAFVTPN